MVERKDTDPHLGRLDELGESSISGSLAGLLRHRTGGADAETDPEVSVGQTRPLAMDEHGPGDVPEHTGLQVGFSPGPGESLRGAREAQGMDVAALAYRTRLSAATIQAMEDNRFQHLPPAYIRGYLRTIARELDVEADSWIRAYEAIGISEPVLKATVQKNLGEPPSGGVSRARWVAVGTLGLAAFVMVGALLWTIDRESLASVDLQRWWGGLAEIFRRDAPEPGDEWPGGSVAESTGEPSPAAMATSAGPLDDLLDVAPVESRVVTEASGFDPPRRSQPSPVPLDIEPASPDSRLQPPPESDPEPETPVDAVTERVETEAAVEAVTRPELQEDDPTPAATPASGPGTVASAGEAAPSPASLPLGPDESVVRLDFIDTSWVEVRSASNRVEVVGIFHDGDSQTLRMELPGRVVLGNANGVRLYRDGSELDLQTYIRSDRTARFDLEKP